VIGVSPEGDAYILDELTNYRYVANTPELDPTASIVSWADQFTRMAALWKTRPMAWVDSNSQFKSEFAHHGVQLLANLRGREVRTEAARQYFQHQRIFMAPWLSMLPYELENAVWPDKTTAAGKYERLKINDHALDCLEHVLSRHPRGTSKAQPPPVQPLIGDVQWMGSPIRKRKRGNAIDVHLGGQ
jgi:hypothetical protein